MSSESKNKAQVMVAALKASGLKFILVIGTDEGLNTVSNLPDDAVSETFAFLAGRRNPVKN